jgi:hypothetical protein
MGIGVDRQACFTQLSACSNKLATQRGQQRNFRMRINEKAIAGSPAACLQKGKRS